MEEISLKEFCALHKKSYDGARAAKIGQALVAVGNARRISVARGVYQIQADAPWPRRMYVRARDRVRSAI